jgi:hypothetical protein
MIDAPSNDSTMSVRLETVNDDFFYVHDEGGVCRTEGEETRNYYVEQKTEDSLSQQRVCE